MSTRFNDRRGTSNNPRANPTTICQKCLGTGHYIYDCKNARPYLSRPSRTKQLEKPALMGPRDKPSVELPDEFRSSKEKRAVVIAGTADSILKAKEKERAAKKTKRSSSTSSSSSGSSSSSSGSDSSSGSSSSGSRSRSRLRSRTPEADRDREKRRRAKAGKEKDAEGDRDLEKRRSSSAEPARGRRS